MSIIDLETMAGVQFDNGEILCAECIEDKELADAKEDQIISITDIENADTKGYFCNRCKKRM